MPRDIFISHTTQDREVAITLCEAIEAAGMTCWIAPRNIDPGSTWASGIMDAITECRVMLLVFSGKSNESVHVVREILHAVEKGRLVFPVRIEDVFPVGGLAYCLVGVQWFDATIAPLENHIQSLVAQMRLVLQQPGGALAGAGMPATGQASPSVPTESLRDIYFQCDYCEQRLVTEAAGAGQSLQCPSCHQTIVIPEIADPSTQQRSAAGGGTVSVSDARLLSSIAVGRLESGLAAIIGPIAPLVVRKAMARTTSLAELRSEVLAAIPTARDQEKFLSTCGDLLPAAESEPAPAPKPPAETVNAPSGAASTLNLAPAAIAELKARLAAFVGPVAKVLVDRAVVRAASVSEFLEILAAEVDSPKGRSDFLQAAKALRL